MQRELLDAILRLGDASLATESAACDAFVRVRFPRGITCPRCRSTTVRTGAQVVCTRGRRPHRFTILFGTAFGTKLKPSLRALFIAARLFALSPRSIPARELARDLQLDHTTVWRHLHTLRALFPAKTAITTPLAASVQVCGRSTAAPPAWARVGATVAVARLLRKPARAGRMQRMVAESLRTLCNGIFRGVSARWLRAYANEARSRWTCRSALADLVVRPLIHGGRALTFRHVRAIFQAG